MSKTKEVTSFDFGVQHGKIFTTFETSKAANDYHRRVMGSVLKVRRSGHWENLE